MYSNTPSQSLTLFKQIIDQRLNMQYNPSMLQKTYAIGNSTVLTVPKSSGLRAGITVKYTRQDTKLIYEILESASPISTEKHIRETGGAFKVKVNNLERILKSLKENPYDKKIRLS